MADDLPASRLIYLRLFAEAPLTRSYEVAAELRASLGGYGDLVLVEGGECDKVPQWIEFNAWLVPRGGVEACLAEMAAGAGDAWREQGRNPGAVWNRWWAPSAEFLHPRLRWAGIGYDA